MSSSPPTGRMESAFRTLLALYPRPFRDEYGREIMLAFTDRLRHASHPAERALITLGAISGVLIEAPKEHGHMLLQDLRYALRSFRNSLGFTLAAILTLALGIGANTAVFSVIDALLLRPLPYPEADRLVMLWETKRADNRGENLVSPANVLDWRSRSQTLERVAMFRPHRVTLTGEGEPIEVQAHSVNSDFFPVLRVAPQLGRLPSPKDDRPGAAPIVVLSYRLWQQRFGGDEQIIGRTLRANATAVTVAGIMPAGFQFMGSDVDMWSPMGLNEAQNWREAAGRFLLAVARLKPGMSRNDAQRELTGIAQQLEREHRTFNAGWGVNVVALRDQLAGKVRTALWVLLCAVGLLLFIACANVANLLLARAATRQREIAVRLAMGANGARLVRQLLTESLLLSLIAATAGLAVAWTAVHLFWALSPLELMHPNKIEIDSRVLAWSAIVAVATGVLFGLAPAATTLCTDVNGALKEGGRGTGGRGLRLRGAFVVAQCALTVVLLVGAGLLLRSFLKLQAQDPGLDARNLLTFRVSLPGARYRETERRGQFFQQARARLEALPGVRSASATSTLPFTGDARQAYVHVAGQPAARPGKELLTLVRVVLPGYFETMRIPQVRGRGFSMDDNRETAPWRFVVNQEFVRRYFNGRDPLRERISVMTHEQNPYAEIIGVAGDVREGSLDKSAEPTVYYPHAHLTYPGMTLVVRTTGNPMALAATARGVIRSLDPNQPVAEVRSMESVLGQTTARQRFSASLFTTFAAMALVLAAIGVYSVLSYTVVERTQEVGMRMALGAQTSDVLRLVVREGMRWAISGLALGVAGALALGRFLQSLLFGVGTADPVTLAGVTGMLLVVCLIAALLPAWRAARLDPMAALRRE